MFKIIFLSILSFHWSYCNNQIWNQVAVDKTYDSNAFYEVTLIDERQCFGQCVYDVKCLSFEAYRKAHRVVECRLFDFVYESYSSTKSMIAKIGAKVHSKPVEPTCVACKSCLDYFKKGHIKNGVYKVDLLGTQRNVYCYMEGEGGGWMAFQRRFDGSVPFEVKEWAEYKNGFGDGSGEYWLGLETLHKLTNAHSYDLYARAMNFTRDWESKRFAGFTIGPENPDKYKLDYQSVYTGNQYSTHDLFVRLKGSKFSTSLQEHDVHMTLNCAARFPGGWWFRDCHHDFMNGRYSTEEACPTATGLHWYRRQGGNHNKCLKETLLMIRQN